MSRDKVLYRIIFIGHKKLYEIYAKSVSQSSLFGFIEVEELIFGDAEAVVVDPSEEKLKTEFEKVKRIYIPMHAISRIDEVEKEGTAKITEINDKDKVTAFRPIYSKAKDK